MATNRSFNTTARGVVVEEQWMFWRRTEVKSRASFANSDLQLASTSKPFTSTPLHQTQYHKPDSSAAYYTHLQKDPIDTHLPLHNVFLTLRRRTAPALISREDRSCRGRD